MVLVEICVDDVDGARTAERCGADRVELCTNLAAGGTTPSLGMVATVLAVLRRVGVQVLVRPRGGDFVYDEDEVATMVADIRAMLALPREVTLGFVINALTASGAVDEPTVAAIVHACEGAPVTFSRAFDEVADQPSAMRTLAGLGVGRVLTAGGPGFARDHVDRLHALVPLGAAAPKAGIEVLAAGGIRADNVEALLAATGVREIHQRAPHQRDGRTRTSADEVSAVVAAVRRADAS